MAAVAKPNQTDRLIRRKPVQERTGLSTTNLYRQISQGLFPRPVVIGARAVAWSEDEVNRWIEERKAERDAELIAS